METGITAINVLQRSNQRNEFLQGGAPVTDRDPRPPKIKVEALQDPESTRSLACKS